MLRPWHYSLVLDKDSPYSIHQQLIDHFRSMIEGGSWLGGSALPSSRDIAQRLGINRKTVSRVYEELSAQGLIYTQPKRGTFVAETSPASRQRTSLSANTLKTVDPQTDSIHHLIQKTSLHHIRRVALHMHKLQANDYDVTGLFNLKHMLANLLAHERRFLVSPDHIACGSWLTIKNALVSRLRQLQGYILVDLSVSPAEVQMLENQSIKVIKLPEHTSGQANSLAEQIEKYCINYPVAAVWCDTSRLFSSLTLDTEQYEEAHLLITQKLADYRLLLIEDQRSALPFGHQYPPLAARYIHSLMLGSLYGKYCDMFNLSYVASNENFSTEFLHALDEQQQQSALLNMLAQSELIKRGEYKKLLATVYRFIG